MIPRAAIFLLRLVLASLHLLVAVISFVRPPMVEVVKGYAKFAEIGDTTTWGTWALTIGLGLLLIPRGPLLILWQFASASYFALFALLVTGGPSGLNWGSGVYGGLSLWSMVLAYDTANDWFEQTRWPQRFRAWLGRRWERRRVR
ncbi:hypothetical protein DAETH_47980 (plasmid) [Deinococcus aetherius]|uniref:DoxX family protein n=1 Tax=Deinococcus aetherius TaxID=200252 RepID=A0ABN6RPZ3_9DEIO|nr:hypothetical protein [Deinococcus aetherius]BDP44829.1 hypothetical protein DAETH_47980 [Deinococcus aetherius]